MLGLRRQAGAFRRFTSEAAAQPAVISVAVHRVPLSTRVVWFSLGLNCTLVLGIYQLSQDASDAAGELELKLKEIRDDTHVIQKGLRSRIAKLEALSAAITTNDITTKPLPPSEAIPFIVIKKSGSDDDNQVTK